MSTSALNDTCEHSENTARYDAVQVEEISYESAWEGASIHAIIWMPPEDTPVIGAVQIVHGMVEYIRRYDDFARFLAVHGFAVAGNDHIGHGESAESVERIGCLPVGGDKMMINDVNVLRMIMEKRVGDVPYFLLGHSMGSFITRAYLAKYGEGLAGAILCGTGEQPLALTKFGVGLAKQVAVIKGWDHRSVALMKLGMGAYNDKIPHPRTSYDWLNTDTVVVDAYMDDPMCGALFSAGGFASLFSLVHTVATKECVKNTPENIPLLFVAGAEDPVGDMGKGVRKAVDAIKERAQVTCTIYDGMRHEILNEPDRKTVYADILAWLNDVIRVPCSK